MFMDNVTASRSSRMDSEVYKSELYAQPQSKTALLSKDGYPYKQELLKAILMSLMAVSVHPIEHAFNS